MSLHGCPHSFEALALHVFPERFDQLATVIEHPLDLDSFAIRPIDVPIDPGCYVVIERGIPIYVGIAKNIRRRLTDHFSRDPSRANLSVRMAAKELSVPLSKIKRHEQFDRAFESACVRLLNCGAAWVEIANPLEMYIFEPYCAMRLDTHEFNFFDTLQILAPASRYARSG